MILDAQFDEQEVELNADFGIVKVVNTGDGGNCVKTVNGIAPDRNGNVEIEGGFGEDGVGILGVEVFQDDANTARFLVALTDGTTQEHTINLPSGQDGKNGVGVYSVEQTTTSTADGGDNVIKVTLTDGEEYTFAVKNGSKGSAGKDGTNGKDGTSVTVASVSESTADGGSNVVTFSDGKTLTVKNGRQGSKGVGIKGDTGKTAYQYAQEGGYAGTEAEFSAKLAKELPTKVSEFTNDSKYITASGAPVQSVNGKTGTVVLDASSVGARPSTWTPTYTDVGAEKSGTATSAVSTHNTKTDAHNDIRLLITALTNRLDALANSDDDTLDQMAEVVAYIKENRGLIEQITTGKVSVSDIVNNLTTNVSNKPLSAGQGVALKALIDAITVPTKLSQLGDDSTHRTVTDAEKSAWNGKSTFSGKYEDLSGKPTIPTVPTNVSAFTNDAGYITGFTETDPTVPAWAKAASKPSYTKSEVGLGNVENVKQYSASNPPPYPVTSVNGKTGIVIIDSDELGAVPDTRKVNGKALSADITLSASDVSAVPTSSALTVTGVDANGTTHTWTMYGVKN